ncbi:hypothetical protein [Ramlibacter sp.]|uniref:hypothetical protein n=1 Tax=Ramlibacter sp. TaxID=1917967 RepID=UPI003D0DB654
MAKPPEITAQWLLARTRPTEYGCLIWTGYTVNKGRDPRATLNGKNLNVRRAIWSVMHDGRDPGSLFVGVSCATPACVEPSCLVARPRSVAFVVGGYVKTLAHRAKIAETKRAKSKVPQSAIAEIINSDLSGPKEAERRGISKDMINRIRAGQYRIDYTNPYLQLQESTA